MNTNQTTRTAALLIVVVTGIVAMAFFSLETSFGTIEGTVLDKRTRLPVGGVQVVPVGHEGAITDSKGNFAFKNLPVGTYEFDVSKKSFAPLKIGKLELKADSTIKLTILLDRSKSDYLIAKTREYPKEESDAEFFQMESTVGTAGSASQKSQSRYSLKGGRGMVSKALSPANGRMYDDMYHTSYGTNPFIDTEDDALSTFGADVSTGSYGLVRNYLTHGEVPPKEAFRVEEFINYFPASYPSPTKETFSVAASSVPSTISKNTRMLIIGLKGREVKTQDRKPADLTFVIDVSGSMDMENRLGLVKGTLLTLLKELKGSDRVGIVTYGSDAEVVLPHTGDHEAIENAIRGLVSNGSTNAEAGLWQGYKLAAAHTREGAISRVILCTDGVANNGETSSAGLLKTIDKYKKLGITLTACGFGMGNYNDVLIEQLATKGDGTYYYIDDMKEARRVFVEQLTGTLQIIAKDVKIQVTFDPKWVSRYRLIGYEKRDVKDEDFRNDKVDGGEIGSGHSVTALYEIKTTAQKDEIIGTITIRYKTPDGNRAEEVVAPISLHSVEHPAEFSRFIGAAALYCEIMRESYWAKHRDVKEVVDLLDDLGPAFRREHPFCEDFRDLVRTTLRLQEGKMADLPEAQ